MHMILVGMSEGNSSLRTLRRLWWILLKWTLGLVDLLDWIDLAQDKVR
jgi:hypothetical protein